MRPCRLVPAGPLAHGRFHNVASVRHFYSVPRGNPPFRRLSFVRLCEVVGGPFENGAAPCCSAALVRCFGRMARARRAAWPLGGGARRFLAPLFAVGVRTALNICWPEEGFDLVEHFEVLPR